MFCTQIPRFAISKSGIRQAETEGIGNIYPIFIEITVTDIDPLFISGKVDIRPVGTFRPGIKLPVNIIRILYMLQ